MKVIFLDIDGVLNNLKRVDIDPTRVEVFNKIIAATGAKVVISSTWRLVITLDKIRLALEVAGFKGEVVGYTKSLDVDSSRGCEIQEWLSRHTDIRNYVILDDDTDMLLDQKDNFVHINSGIGIAMDHVEQAIRILNNQQGD